MGPGPARAVDCRLEGVKGAREVNSGQPGARVAATPADLRDQNSSWRLQTYSVCAESYQRYACNSEAYVFWKMCSKSPPDAPLLYCDLPGRG